MQLTKNYDTIKVIGEAIECLIYSPMRKCLDLRKKRADSHLNSSKVTSVDESKESKEEAVKIYIEGNLLKWRGSLIHINNIQRVTYWIKPLPPKPTNVYLQRNAGLKLKQLGISFCIGGGIVGILSLILAVISPLLLAILLLCGLVAIAKGINYVRKGQAQIVDANSKISAWKQDVAEAEENKNLYIHMSSGKKHALRFSSKEKLMQVYNGLAEAFKRDGKTEDGRPYYFEGDAIVINVYNSGNILQNSSVGNGASLTGTNLK